MKRFLICLEIMNGERAKGHLMVCFLAQMVERHLRLSGFKNDVLFFEIKHV
ncbi:hypothetical protein [Pleomorphovibrio marinus]|uniref:hypothetical protein n=1 Tax=Pleomorphovibrio marinus TaxID=2164132 RepID=UPI001300AB84|nr:hypothetical protein [Pleomorphovibrio marinus]